MRRQLILILALGACSGSTRDGGAPPATEAPQQPPVQVTDPAPVAPQTPPAADAAPVLPSLSEADCRAFGDAPALALARATSSVADCSSVGHSRLVLDVVRTARGPATRRVELSYTLGGNDDVHMPVDGIAIVGIDPEKRPAETVYCVPLPARDGVVRHAVLVPDAATGERMLDAMSKKTLCP